MKYLFVAHYHIPSDRESLTRDEITALVFSHIYNGGTPYAVSRIALSSDDPGIVASSLMRVEMEYEPNQNGGDPANDL